MSVKYDNWFAMPRFLLRKNALITMLKHLNLNEKDCLEVGYGAGEILKLIAEYDAKVTGFDFSEEALDLVQHRLNTFHKKDNIHLTSDEEELKIGGYDYVFAFEVLEHIKNDQWTFSKWLEYLKPGGSLFLSVPAHMKKWGDSDVWAGHYRRYEKKELIQLCVNNDAVIKELWNYGYPLSIILDKLLHSSKKNEVRMIGSSAVSNDERSKKSGIKRDNKLLYRLISNDLMLYPFYILQKLFYKTDLGSGYILHILKK